MPLYKNVASQKITVFAFDKTTGDPVTGDAANITAQISKDAGASAATNDANPAELDATDHPGKYVFDLTQAETNANLIDFQAFSSTGDVVFDPISVYTTLEVAAVNLTQIGGDAQSATDLKDFADAGYDPGTNKVQGVVLVDTATTTTTATNVTTVNGLAAGVITAASIATGAIDADAIAADAVTEIQSGLATQASVDTIDNLIDTEVAAIKTVVDAIEVDTQDIQSRIPAVLVSGRIDASVGAMAANVMTAAAAAADLTTELQSGLSTLDAAGIRTAVGLASANLDTQLDALPTAAENTTAVWGAATRVLTAGTNIALAKGTGVTGFTDIDAAGVRTAVGLGSANLDTQLDALPTAVENAAALLTSTSNVTEPSAVPAWSASFGAKIAWMFAQMRNKLTQTATTKTLRNDADNATISTSTVSDDGTTFTHGEWQ